MDLQAAINAMSDEELTAFALASVLNVPKLDGPELNSKHLFVTMPLRGMDPNSVEDLLRTLTDPHEQNASSVAARAFVTGIRLAQHILDARTGNMPIVEADRPD